MSAHAKYGNFLLFVPDTEEIAASTTPLRKRSSGARGLPVIYHRNGRKFLLPDQAQVCPTCCQFVTYGAVTEPVSLPFRVRLDLTFL